MNVDLIMKLDSITSKIRLQLILLIDYFKLLQLCLKKVSSVYQCSQHYTFCDYIFNLYFKMKGCLLFPNVSGIFIFWKKNIYLNIIKFVHIVFQKTVYLFGEHWYHVFFLLHCYYMTRRICGIKQVIIIAFFCWLIPIMLTPFPSLAITSFLHFSYGGITFTQCATKCPGINCYYRHQSSSLLLLPLFL